jgi:hypothetical protein
VKNNFDTSVFETHKDAFDADIVKKYGAFTIKHFGSFIVMPNSEDGFASVVVALAAAIALCFSHHKLDKRVVTSHSFTETFKQVSYPNLLHKVSDKEYALIRNMDA